MYMGKYTGSGEINPKTKTKTKNEPKNDKIEIEMVTV